MKRMRMRKWRTSEVVIVAVVAAPFLFLAWSAWRSTVYDAAMEQKVRSSFESVPCEITSSYWTQLQGRSSTNQAAPISGYDVHVEYSYSVDGHAYVSQRIKPRYKTIGSLPEAEAFIARYPARKRHTCYYDPDKPSVAFLEQ
jgi:hypothetical protein